MTTIAEKLALLANTKAEIEAAIEAKGVDVPAGLPFASYAEKIAAIQSGGGGGNPDPSVYCPVNGYFKQSEEYVPDQYTIDLPTPNTEEIYLALSDQGDCRAGILCSVNSGTYTTEVIDPKTGVVVATYTTNSSAQCLFSIAKGGGKPYFDFTVYWVRIYPTTAGNKITVFRHVIQDIMNQGGAYFLAAKINAPSITTLLSVFSGNCFIRHCEFVGSANLCTSGASMFYMCLSLRYVKMPESMTSCTTLSQSFYYCTVMEKLIFSSSLPAVTDMSNALYGVGIKELIMPTSMPALTTLSYFLSYSKIRSVILPEQLPELTNFSSVFANSCFLEYVKMPLSMPKTNNISSAFSGSFALKGSIIFPDMPLCTNMSAAFSNAFNVEEIIFTGPMNQLVMFIPFSSCKNLKRLVCPTSLNAINNASYFIGSAGFQQLEKLVLPVSMNASPMSAGSLLGTLATPFLKEITKTESWTSTALVFSQSYLVSLKRFDQPTLKLTYFNFSINGASTANSIRGALEYVDFDESLLTYISITFCSLPLSEIIKICDRLPIRTSKANALFNNNKSGFVTAAANPWNTSVTKYRVWISNSDVPTLGVQVGMAMYGSTWCGFTLAVVNSLIACPALMPAGRRVVVTGVSGITGLTPYSGMEYYIVNATSTTFQLSNSPGGNPITITGTGTVYLSITAFVTAIISYKEVDVDVPCASSSNSGVQFGFGFDFTKYIAKGWEPNIAGA